jgi:hypothetical protein
VCAELSKPNDKIKSEVKPIKKGIVGILKKKINPAEEVTKNETDSIDKQEKKLEIEEIKKDAEKKKINLKDVIAEQRNDKLRDILRYQSPKGSSVIDSKRIITKLDTVSRPITVNKDKIIMGKVIKSVNMNSAVVKEKKLLDILSSTSDMPIQNQPDDELSETTKLLIKTTLQSTYPSMQNSKLTTKTTTKTNIKGQPPFQFPNIGGSKTGPKSEKGSDDSNLNSFKDGLSGLDGLSSFSLLNMGGLSSLLNIGGSKTGFKTEQIKDPLSLSSLLNIGGPQTGVKTEQIKNSLGLSSLLNMEGFNRGFKTEQGKDSQGLSSLLNIGSSSKDSKNWPSFLNMGGLKPGLGMKDLSSLLGFKSKPSTQDQEKLNDESSDE